MRSGEFRSPTLKMLATVFGCIVLVSGAGEDEPSSSVRGEICVRPRLQQRRHGRRRHCRSGAYYTSINVHNPNKDAVEIL